MVNRSNSLSVFDNDLEKSYYLEIKQWIGRNRKYSGAWKAQSVEATNDHTTVVMKSNKPQ